MYKKFQVNRTKIKGGCQSETKAAHCFSCTDLTLICLFYGQEKKHIKEEDRLKKDMMSKLESVAAEFRKAANAQMSATTQRTIRENVNVSGIGKYI